MVQIKKARVSMWGKTVGELCQDDNRGTCVFTYDPLWIASGIEISPIWMPLSERELQFPSLPHATYRGLPGAFADTLPDDFGTAVTEAWLVRNGHDKDALSALQRLQLEGSRGMGALEYAPALEPELEQQQPLQIRALVETAQWVLDQRAQRQQPNVAPATDEALTALLQVGTSAGGARPKAVIGINGHRTEFIGGHTDLPKGFEHYLIKFDGVVERSDSRETFGDPQGYGRMEFAYFLMAQAAGVDISPCELLIEGERAHFLTQRFDRRGNDKLHYLSLCAMDQADYQQPGSYSYERLFAVVQALKLPHSQVLKLYRRMVFNVVARNHDDHTKNFGFMLDESNQWQLAPAFDVAFSYRPGSKFVSCHQMALNGKREDFSRADLLALADGFQDEARHIIDEVVDVVAQWPQYVKDAGVSLDFAQQIRDGHRLHLCR